MQYMITENCVLSWQFSTKEFKTITNAKFRHYVRVALSQFLIRQLPIKGIVLKRMVNGTMNFHVALKIITP